MEKNNRGSLTAKQQQRRIASKDRRKRRVAKRNEQIESRIKVLRVAYGRLEAELAQYKRADVEERNAEPATSV